MLTIPGNIIPGENSRFGGLLPPTVSGVSIPTTIVVGTPISVSYTLGGGPAVVVTRAWYRGATLIASSTTSDSYTPVQADAGNTSNIFCRVIPVNAAGSASADSNTVAQVLDATWYGLMQAVSITNTSIINVFNTYTIARKAAWGTTPVAEYVAATDKSTSAAILADYGRNLFNPADTNAARRLTYGGTVTGSAQGWQGNGVNGFANTNINQQVDLGGDFTIYFYSRTNQTRGEVDFGAMEPTIFGIQLASRFSDGNTYTAFRTNEINAGAIVTNTGGFFLIKRSGNNLTIKRNNVTIYSSTSASNTNTNTNMYIMARNYTTPLYSSKQYTHFGFVAAASTNQQDTDLYNAVLAKETALGRNV